MAEKADVDLLGIWQIIETVWPKIITKYFNYVIEL